MLLDCHTKTMMFFRYVIDNQLLKCRRVRAEDVAPAKKKFRREILLPQRICKFHVYDE